MHSGVQRFIRWLESNKELPNVELRPAATQAEIAGLEQQLGVPLPADLRFVLRRFNGGKTPNGTLLPCGVGPGTIEAEVRRLAERLNTDFLDPEILLPFHRTNEGSLLAFDRSAGPVSDTWPVVDYYEDTGEVRLVFRTFDGWCRTAVAEWTSADFGQPFSLDTYLRQGERHVQIEPDVSTAHATVAHALKRAGEPDRALASYLRAARCLPPVPWCDWEAAKLATLLKQLPQALEACSRLCARGPKARWDSRETTPARVADLIAILMPLARDPANWMRMIDLLVEQADDEDEAEHVRGVRLALVSGDHAPDPEPPQEVCPAPPVGEPDAWWAAAKAAYEAGRLRDDDILFDARLRSLWTYRDPVELLRIRRSF